MDMTVDTVRLTNIINQCFENSTDGRFSPADRAEFLANGKRLRGHLINLLSAQFDASTESVVIANQKLEEVNGKLINAVEVLQNTAQTLGNIAQLVGLLDRLLNVAVAFL